jgi:pyridoxal phosphate enzyme (YggS family)
MAMNPDPRSVLTARLAAVEERLSAACRRAGRARSEVTLVAVTKTVGPEVAALMPELGVLDLGENRPQELWRKAALLPTDVSWHLIGHLQRNKIERTLPLIRLIHSVDSVRLLHELERTDCDEPLPVLLEVNASGEASKQGFQPEEVAALEPVLIGLRRVRLDGLMTMAALEDDPQRCRPTFIRLRELRDQLRGLVGNAHPLNHLSMGMSNDFEVAVAEGATLVRLGALGLKRSQVQLIGGLTSRDKRFLIRGLTRVELEAKLAALL